MGYLRRILRNIKRPSLAAPIVVRDRDAELAELAALIEGDDISEAKLERMADLLGQGDPNRKQF